MVYKCNIYKLFWTLLLERDGNNWNLSFSWQTHLTKKWTIKGIFMCLILKNITKHEMQSILGFLIHIFWFNSSNCPPYQFLCIWSEKIQLAGVHWFPIRSWVYPITIVGSYMPSIDPSNFGFVKHQEGSKLNWDTNPSSLKRSLVSVY